MPTKIWVNIEGGDPAKHEGRVVQFNLKASETKPGASKGQDVWVIAEPDGGNEDATFVGASHRGQNFQTDPPYSTKVTLEGTSTPAKIQISIPGGDKWKFKVSKKEDGSGAKSAPGDGFEAWRKVFTCVGHMTGCKSVDPTSLNGKLAKLFIEIEKKGAMRELPHSSNCPKPGPAIGDLDKAVGTIEFPGITVKLVFVDRIMDAGERKWDLDLTPGDFDSKRRTKVKVKNGDMTWPFDDWILSGKIYLFDGKGQRMAEDPIQNFIRRAKVGSRPPGSNALSFEHKEGLSTNRLILDLKTFPNIERWMAEKGAQAKVYLGIRVIEGVAGGMASAGSPWIIMATRNGWDYKDEKHLSTILLHEYGHVLGHVLRFVPRFVADTGVSDDRDDNSFWYDKHGGTGNHCHHGSTLGTTTCKAGPGACVMYHASPGQGTDFCDSCQRILKRAPLDRLGRINVWGPDAWNENP